MRDIVEIVLEGPAKNALGMELMRSLRARIAAAEGRPLLLRGSGDAFSAGLNLQEIVAADADGALRFLAELDGLAVELFRHPAPTVAAVNGHAIAGG